MYIAPDTSLKIIKGCPINNDYQDTIYFDSLDEQINYFLSITKYSLDKLSYQRMNSGRLRVEIPVENLYDCNYMMFKNKAFSNKWFFAFIENVEYVNNVTSEITYSIDVMQSWHFDYELLPAFITREHSATDNIGENTVPENLETGPYITTSSSKLLTGDLYVYMLLTELIADVFPPDVVIEPSTIGGFPQPCYVIKLGQLTTFTGIVIKAFLEAYSSAGKNDAVIAIFTAPGNFISTTQDIRENVIIGAPRVLSKQPKNNKLYTYPFCANVSVCNGTSVELRYELFNNQQPNFISYSGFGVNLNIAIIPTNYGGNEFDIMHTMSLSGFPILPWIKEYFQNWLAQNKATLAVSTVKDIVGVVGGLIPTGGMGAYSVPYHGVGGSGSIRMPSSLKFGNIGDAINSAFNIANTVAQVYQQSIVPDSMVGNANAVDIMSVTGKNGFYNFCRSIRPEYIDIIDGYFDMFGYATHKIKVPNRNVRPHWTYTKTENCALKGDLPEQHINLIRQIYNKGVRFWKNPNEIGNYSLDNKV